MTERPSSTEPRRTALPEGHQTRLDIQVLRAVAVGMVLMYHLWPNRVPGGYAGVDAFFVISGFLITLHLLREAERTEGLRVLRFWAKRARRLLPVATFVLLLTIPAVLTWMPLSTHKTALHDIIASTLYVQNWNLASASVDYLARDNVPSVVQHYWSLSAEEQFYIIWPLLILASTLIVTRWVAPHAQGAARSRSTRTGALVALSTVFVVSLAYGVHLTATSPGTAYFATTTRAWEFAAGGLLAFLPATVTGSSRTRAVQAARLTASWVGLALLAGVALLMPEDAAFPGLIALVPVVGTCLLIWAGDTGHLLSPSALGRVRPLTYIGDISYGIYLWHWPIVVILPYAFGQALRTQDKIGIIAVTILLAAVSKVLIEDPFRARRFWRASTLRGFVPAAVGMTIVVAVAGVAIVDIDRSAAAASSSFVARPLSDGGRNDLSQAMVPSLAARSDDHAQMYDCFDLEQKGPRTCDYGPKDAKVSLAIVGDSHAAHFIPPLIEIAEKQGWRLRTYVGLNCDAALGSGCAGGRKILTALERTSPDLVLFSTFRGSSSPQQGVATYFAALVDAGLPLLPIADVPANPRSAFDCVDRSGGDIARAVRCTTPRAAALDEIPDRVAPLAKRYDIPYLDLTDVFCSATTCRDVISNVVVYADSPSSHMTRTFAMLLAPRLQSAAEDALASRDKRP